MLIKKIYFNHKLIKKIYSNHMLIKKIYFNHMLIKMRSISMSTLYLVTTDGIKYNWSLPNIPGYYR